MTIKRYKKSYHKTKKKYNIKKGGGRDLYDSMSIKELKKIRYKEILKNKSIKELKIIRDKELSKKSDHFIENISVKRDKKHLSQEELDTIKYNSLNINDKILFSPHVISERLYQLYYLRDYKLNIEGNKAYTFLYYLYIIYNSHQIKSLGRSDEELKYFLDFIKDYFIDNRYFENNLNLYKLFNIPEYSWKKKEDNEEKRIPIINSLLFKQNKLYSIDEKDEDFVDVIYSGIDNNNIKEKYRNRKQFRLKINRILYEGGFTKKEKSKELISNDDIDRLLATIVKIIHTSIHYIFGDKQKTIKADNEEDYLYLYLIKESDNKIRIERLNPNITDTKKILYTIDEHISYRDIPNIISNIDKYTEYDNTKTYNFILKNNNVPSELEGLIDFNEQYKMEAGINYFKYNEKNLILYLIKIFNIIYHLNVNNKVHSKDVVFITDIEDDLIYLVFSLYFIYYEKVGINTQLKVLTNDLRIPTIKQDDLYLLNYFQNRINGDMYVFKKVKVNEEELTIQNTFDNIYDITFMKGISNSGDIKDIYKNNITNIEIDNEYIDNIYTNNNEEFLSSKDDKQKYNDFFHIFLSNDERKHMEYIDKINDIVLERDKKVYYIQIDYLAQTIKNIYPDIDNHINENIEYFFIINREIKDKQDIMNKTKNRLYLFYISDKNNNRLCFEKLREKYYKKIEEDDIKENDIYFVIENTSDQILDKVKIIEKSSKDGMYNVESLLNNNEYEVSKQKLFSDLDYTFNHNKFRYPGNIEKENKITMSRRNPNNIHHKINSKFDSFFSIFDDLKSIFLKEEKKEYLTQFIKDSLSTIDLLEDIIEKNNFRVLYDIKLLRLKDKIGHFYDVNHLDDFRKIETDNKEIIFSSDDDTRENKPFKEFDAQEKILRYLNKLIKDEYLNNTEIEEIKEDIEKMKNEVIHDTSIEDNVKDVYIYSIKFLEVIIDIKSNSSDGGDYRVNNIRKLEEFFNIPQVKGILDTDNHSKFNIRKDFKFNIFRNLFDFDSNYREGYGDKHFLIEYTNELMRKKDSIKALLTKFKNRFPEMKLLDLLRSQKEKTKEAKLEAAKKEKNNTNKKSTGVDTPSGILMASTPVRATTP